MYCKYFEIKMYYIIFVHKRCTLQSFHLKSCLIAPVFQKIFFQKIYRAIWRCTRNEHVLYFTFLFFYQSEQQMHAGETGHMCLS